MRIDPGNKLFIVVFAVIVLGVIGFFIATIFIDVSKDVELKTIEFGQSKFRVEIKQLKSDKSFIAQVFNGGKLISLSVRPTLVEIIN